MVRPIDVQYHVMPWRSYISIFITQFDWTSNSDAEGQHRPELRLLVHPGLGGDGSGRPHRHLLPDRRVPHRKEALPLRGETPTDDGHGRRPAYGAVWHVLWAWLPRGTSSVQYGDGRTATRHRLRGPVCFMELINLVIMNAIFHVTVYVMFHHSFLSFEYVNERRL